MSSSEFNEAQWILQPEVLNAIRELQHLSTPEVSLKLSKTNLPASFIANQIRGRKMAAKKFPWTLDIEGFIYPPGINLEQSSSAETAQYKTTHFIQEGDHVLDGSAGMGMDAMAFAKKAAKVTALEPNTHLAAILQHNASQEGIENLEVINSTLEEFMDLNTLSFDLIYLDPDRRSVRQKAISLADCTPDLTTEHERIRSCSSRQLYKLSPMMDLSLATLQIHNIHEVHIVGNRNECKEVLLYGKPSQPTDIRIVCADHKDKWELFEYTREEESDANESFGEPDKYLYIPSATILKAGPYQLFAKKYGLTKLAPDTHIYTSDSLKKVQGRGFEVIETTTYNKRALGELMKKHGSSYNVICRNFGLRAPQFITKHKIKEGGKLYLLAYRDSHGNLLVSVCTRCY